MPLPGQEEHKEHEELPLGIIPVLPQTNTYVYHGFIKPMGEGLLTIDKKRLHFWRYADNAEWECYRSIDPIAQAAQLCPTERVWLSQPNTSFWYRDQNSSGELYIMIANKEKVVLYALHPNLFREKAFVLRPLVSPYPLEEFRFFTCFDEHYVVMREIIVIKPESIGESGEKEPRVAEYYLSVWDTRTGTLINRTQVINRKKFGAWYAHHTAQDYITLTGDQLPLLILDIKQLLSQPTITPCRLNEKDKLPFTLWGFTFLMSNNRIIHEDNGKYAIWQYLSDTQCMIQVCPFSLPEGTTIRSHSELSPGIALFVLRKEIPSSCETYVHIYDVNGTTSRLIFSCDIPSYRYRWSDDPPNYSYSSYRRSLLPDDNYCSLLTDGTVMLLSNGRYYIWEWNVPMAQQRLLETGDITDSIPYRNPRYTTCLNDGHIAIYKDFSDHLIMITLPYLSTLKAHEEQKAIVAEEKLNELGILIPPLNALVRQFLFFDHKPVAKEYLANTMGSIKAMR